MPEHCDGSCSKNGVKATKKKSKIIALKVAPLRIETRRFTCSSMQKRVMQKALSTNSSIVSYCGYDIRLLEMPDKATNLVLGFGDGGMADRLYAASYIDLWTS